MVMLPTCLDCIPPEVGSISLEQRDGEQGDLSKAIAVTPLSISSIEAPGAIAQAEFSERTPDPSSPVPATPLHKEWTPVPLEPHHQTPASTPQSILRLGSRGEAVQALQTQLQQRGYYTDSIDGIFGRRTQAAVRAWQRSQNLTPDGVVGSNTWATFAPPAPEAPLKPFTTQPSLATPKAEAPELPSESPPRPQTQQPSPIIFATDSPSYAPWFLGWGVIYGAGWVIIIRDGVQQRQVKRSKRSTPIETPLAQPPLPQRPPPPPQRQLRSPLPLLLPLLPLPRCPPAPLFLSLPLPLLPLPLCSPPLLPQKSPSSKPPEKKSRSPWPTPDNSPPRTTSFPTWKTTTATSLTFPMNKSSPVFPPLRQIWRKKCSTTPSSIARKVYLCCAAMNYECSRVG